MYICVLCAYDSVCLYVCMYVCMYVCVHCLNYNSHAICEFSSLPPKFIGGKKINLYSLS